MDEDAYYFARKEQRVEPTIELYIARELRNRMQANLKLSADEHRQLARILFDSFHLAILKNVSVETLNRMYDLGGPNGRFLLKVLLARYYGDTPDESTGDDNG